MAMPRLPGESGASGEDRAAALGLGARAGDAGRAVGVHQRPAVRLLLIADLDHEDLDFEAEQLPGEGERRAPLPGAGFGRQLLDAGFLVVVGLRHRRVGLVAAGRADALVLVEDARRRIERLFEAARAEQRRRPPQLVNLAHRLGDFDPALGGHFLRDQRHREDRRQVGRSDRLLGARMQRRRQRLRQVGRDVVPGLRNAIFRQKIFNAVTHDTAPAALIV